MSKAFGSSAGLTLRKTNPAAPTKGMVNYLTTTYLSGWQVGDSRLAALADTTAETITGAELVTNGTFTTDVSGWTAYNGATIAQSTGTMVITGVTANSVQGAFQYITTVPGQVYTVSVEEVGSLPVNRYFWLGTVLGGSNLGAISNTDFVSGTNQITFTAATTTTYISLAVYTTGKVLTVDNVSCRLAVEDRSVKNNGVQVYGSLTKTQVAPGADLVAYSGFSSTNYLEQPYNPDLDFGTGDFCIMGWFNSVNSYVGLLDRKVIGWTAGTRIQIQLAASGSLFFYGSTVSITTDTADRTGGTWHSYTLVRSSGTTYLYVDANLLGSTVDTTNYTDVGAVLRVGAQIQAGGYALDHKQALLRIGATAPSADQIRHIYESEKVLFQDNSKCTLYGTSDAVTDMAYDEITGQLGVLTSSGLSRFDGLRRVSEQAGSFSKVASNNGLEVLL